MQIPFSETLIQALGWTLVHSLWQGCVMAFITALLLHIYKHKSAQLRYILAYTCLLCLFFTTATTFVMLFKAQNSKNTEGGISTQQDVVETVFYGGENSESIFFTTIWIKKATLFFNTHLTEISITWFIGLLFFGIKLSFGLMHLRQWQKRGGIPLDDDLWQIRLRHFQQQLSINRPIKLLASTWTVIPLTIGWLKPLIFIPIGMVNKLSSAEVEAILAHELIHIAERDYLLNFIQALIEVVFYHHPAVWWLSTVIRTEREMRCDEKAVRLCQNDAVSYAKALVRLQEHFDSTLPPYLTLAFNKKESTLSRRVKNLFPLRTKQSTIMEKIILTALLVGALCALSFVKNEVKMPEKVHFTEGVKPLSKTENDTFPQPLLVVTRTNSEKEPSKLDDTTRYKKTVFDVQTTLSDGSVMQGKNIHLTVIDEQTKKTAPMPTEQTVVTGMNRDKALVDELVKDGFIPENYPYHIEVDIRPNSLKVNNKFVGDAEIHQKYMERFVLSGTRFTFIKNAGNFEPSKVQIDSLPTPNPPKPPNAIKGHCYAYCQKSNDSPDFEWLEVVCREKVNDTLLKALVNKLKSEGFLPANFTTTEITKEVGLATTAYQKKHKLPIGNLNLPTLKHIGIEMP